MTDENVKKRGRKPKIIDDAFFKTVLEKIKNGDNTSVKIGVSDYYIKNAMRAGYLTRVEVEKTTTGRGRKSKVYALTQAGEDYLSGN